MGLQERKNIDEWNVPGWKLKKYLASGAYGHTFLAEGEGGIWRVIKIYELSDDAKDDLIRIYNLGPDAGDEKISEALKQAMAHDSMFQLQESLSYDEKRHVSLPQAIVPGVVSSDLQLATYASVNNRLETILADEIRKGKYDSYEDAVPLIEEVLKAVAVVHTGRMAKPSPAIEIKAKVGELVPPLEISDFGGWKSWAHNDIKDTNMAVGDGDEIVLFDFGIATTISAREHHDYENVASLLMRAPELEHVGSKPDSRSDVWQLGCFIYSLVTRKNPYKGRKEGPFGFSSEEKGKKGTPKRIEFERKRRSIIESEIGDIISHLRNIGAPKTLVEIISKALSINRDDRYADAEEMLEDFRKKEYIIRLERIAIERGDNYRTRKSELEDAYGAFECSSSCGEFLGIIVDAERLGHYFLREWFERTTGAFVSRNCSYKSSPKHDSLFHRFLAAETEEEKQELRREAAEMQYNFRRLNHFEPISKELVNHILSEVHIDSLDIGSKERHFNRLTVVAAKKDDADGTAHLLEFARMYRVASLAERISKWAGTQEGFYDDIKVKGNDSYETKSKAGRAMSAWESFCRSAGAPEGADEEAERMADSLHRVYNQARTEFIWRQSRLKMAVEMVDSRENIEAMIAWAPRNNPAPEAEKIKEFITELLVDEKEHELRIYAGKPQIGYLAELTGSFDVDYILPCYGEPFFVIVLGEQAAAQRAARKVLNYLRAPLPGETNRDDLFKD